MTNEEREIALFCLRASSDYHSEMCEECIKYPNCDHTGQDDVTETIIKALEQKPCEDVISREAVIDCFKKWQPFMATRIYEYEQELKALSPVTPQPKTGHWIEHPHETGENWEYSKYECSECHVWEEDDSDYCPNCGAKMIEPQTLAYADQNTMMPAT